MLESKCNFRTWGKNQPFSFKKGKNKENVNQIIIILKCKIPEEWLQTLFTESMTTGCLPRLIENSFADWTRQSFIWMIAKLNYIIAFDSVCYTHGLPFKMSLLRLTRLFMQLDKNYFRRASFHFPVLSQLPLDLSHLYHMHEKAWRLACMVMFQR